MGTWGASLYEDDRAGDLKTSVSLVCQVPGDGDRLLDLLRQMHGDPDPEEADGALFWLVVADQFEKRGIACEVAARTALEIIDRGTDLRHAQAAGGDAAFLAQRARGLQILAGRLRAPRPTRPRRPAGKPPALVLQEGDIHAFPTMDGRAWHPYRLPSDGPFEPDGWGALVVLATGRAFDWLPWAALASLTVDPRVRPTLEAALGGHLICHPQTQGAGRFVPKAAHAKGLGLEHLGHVDLDPARVAPQLSRWSVLRAIQVDWTIAYGAIATGRPGVPVGVELATLLRAG